MPSANAWSSKETYRPVCVIVSKPSKMFLSMTEPASTPISNARNHLLVLCFDSSCCYSASSTSPPKIEASPSYPSRGGRGICSWRFICRIAHQGESQHTPTCYLQIYKFFVEYPRLMRCYWQIF